MKDKAIAIARSNSSRRFLRTVRAVSPAIRPVFETTPSLAKSTDAEQETTWTRHSFTPFNVPKTNSESSNNSIDVHAESQINRPIAKPFPKLQFAKQTISSPIVSRNNRSIVSHAETGHNKEQQQPGPNKSKLRPRKAAIRLTNNAVQHLTKLLDSPTPQMIRIGVKNRGCSGLTYHLEYVDQPGKFDEEIVQDGVKVLIDSKALFSIIGSEMDWVDDKLSSRFVFNNPNSKGQCGCGESFMV